MNKKRVGAPCVLGYRPCVKGVWVGNRKFYKYEKVPVASLVVHIYPREGLTALEQECLQYALTCMNFSYEFPTQLARSTEGPLAPVEAAND